MLKLNQVCTIQDFIKYAPYGLVLRHKEVNTVKVFYNLSLYEASSETAKEGAKDCMIAYTGCFKPGYMHRSGTFNPEPISGAWYNFSGNWVVHKLPNVTRLKRKTKCLK